MLLRIEGRDLPGMPGIAVAVQARDKPAELLEPVRGDAAEAVWELSVEPFTNKRGERTLRGRHVQDGIGGRFVYLSWNRIGEDGGHTMFCRSKLMLSGIPQEVYEAGVAAGALRARFGLTNAKGQPVTARLLPPAVEWTAG
ncbi:hypothetical protein ABH926_006660 [Catenulispora sp. GP43]|uniref:DUF5990 family protein n=1 Tax=Catenulispora sp. GP43 TaxID=3156263 RepID=UPI00351681CF